MEIIQQSRLHLLASLNAFANLAMLNHASLPLPPEDPSPLFLGLRVPALPDISCLTRGLTPSGTAHLLLHASPSSSQTLVLLPWLATRGQDTKLDVQPRLTDHQPLRWNVPQLAIATFALPFLDTAVPPTLLFLAPPQPTLALLATLTLVLTALPGTVDATGIAIRGMTIVDAAGADRGTAVVTV